MRWRTAHPTRVARQRLALQPDLAAIQHLQPVGTPQQRGLARTGRPDQAHHLPRANLHRHAGQRDEFAKPLLHVVVLQHDAGHSLIPVIR